jgi:hypothetical protein
MNRKKTTNKKNKYLRIFNKYGHKKEHVTIKQIKLLIKKEFKTVYSKHVFNSFIAIWSSNVNGKQVITKSTFLNKLFKKPNGFFRDIHL